MASGYGLNGGECICMGQWLDLPAKTALSLIVFSQAPPAAFPFGRSCSRATLSTAARKMARARRSACRRWKTTTNACTIAKRCAAPAEQPRHKPLEPPWLTRFLCPTGRESEGATSCVPTVRGKETAGEPSDGWPNTESWVARQRGGYQEGAGVELEHCRRNCDSNLNLCIFGCYLTSAFEETAVLSGLIDFRL